jgi:hypothetical protein
MQTENEAYVELLCSHLSFFTDRLSGIPPDKWEWTPTVPAPSPRIIAEHTWHWLVADRQHLVEADVTKHNPVPDAPTDQKALCDAITVEKLQWHEILMSLTPEQFAEERFHFGTWPRNVRAMVVHIAQEVIYKHGQLSTLFFALGLDGDGPYIPPFPNEDYQRLSEMMQRPLHKAVLSGDIEAVRSALAQGNDGHMPSASGDTPLKLAVMRNQPDVVTLLLEHGADGNETDKDGNTLLVFAVFCGNTKAAEALVQNGVDIHRANRWNGTPLGFAEMRNNVDLITILKQAGAEK